MSRQYYNRYSKRVISPLLYLYMRPLLSTRGKGALSSNHSRLFSRAEQIHDFTHEHTYMHTQLCGRLSLLFRLVNTLLSSARNGSSYCPIPAEFVQNVLKLSQQPRQVSPTCQSCCSGCALFLNKKPSCRQDSRPYCQKLQRSRDLGHAHFQGKFLCACLSFSIERRVPNLKSLAQLVLEICSIICQNFQASRDLGQAHFEGNFCAPARHSPYKAAYQI